MIICESTITFEWSANLNAQCVEWVTAPRLLARIHKNRCFRASDTAEHGSLGISSSICAKSSIISSLEEEIELRPAADHEMWRMLCVLSDNRAISFVFLFCWRDFLQTFNVLYACLEIQLISIKCDIDNQGTRRKMFIGGTFLSTDLRIPGQQYHLQQSP